ncbi:hypothetical protein PFUGPA_00409 [Plasmodium falciparum Palo Alto/Uganda]|uniref:Uncharacterized protein n=1 Tax=Plasmodium falciparum (isolate Palo Alto / Uganda) TaxID=57270 RepID=W4J5J7_PLAFP|nr:hypothetical protein PFUGPA_00409 [Plasmodium falciparum Palo Alto/Uganda]
MMPNPNQSLITTASSSNDILDETSKKKNHYTNRKNKYHSEYQITIDKNKLVHNILENKYVKDILNV